MKLWLLLPTKAGHKELPCFEYAAGFVTRARSAVKARKMVAHRGREVEGRPFWRNPTLSTCVELKPEGKEEIVMEDWAGV